MHHPSTLVQPTLRVAYDSHPQSLPSPDYQIQQILLLLHQDLRHHHHINDLAITLEISPRQFERRFKAATGYSLQQYGKKIRLEKASELLTTTLLSVKEISLAIGIGEVKHFIAAFKQVYRLTPVAYRKRMYGKWRDVACRL